MTNGSLMKVKSIAECSHWSILQYFWTALSDNWSWKPIFDLFESGRFTHVLLYFILIAFRIFLNTTLDLVQGFRPIPGSRCRFKHLQPITEVKLSSTVGSVTDTGDRGDRRKNYTLLWSGRYRGTCLFSNPGVIHTLTLHFTTWPASWFVNSIF